MDFLNWFEYNYPFLYQEDEQRLAKEYQKYTGNNILTTDRNSNIQEIEFEEVKA